EAVRRDDAAIGADVDEALLIEVLRIDHGREDVGEDLELGGAADVVAAARGAIADDAPARGRLAHLARLERLDHAVLARHAADPSVALDSHDVPHEVAAL